MNFSRIKSFISDACKFATIRFSTQEWEEILVLGDSHVDIFNHERIRSFFKNYRFTVISVGGATVSGLPNPNSKTQALPIFMKSIKKSRARTIIISLGEVDTGFVIWYRAEKYHIKVSEILESALNNYANLLLLLSKTHRVICISTPLPTIKDGQDWGEIANARKDVNATQLQRTKLTLQFNNHMQNFCQKNAIAYLYLDDDSIGRNGIVDSKLLNQDPTDHHYDPNSYADMIIQKLQGYIEDAALSEDSALLHSYR